MIKKSALKGTPAQRKAKWKFLHASPAMRRKWAVKAAKTRCEKRLSTCHSSESFPSEHHVSHHAITSPHSVQERGFFHHDDDILPERGEYEAEMPDLSDVIDEDTTIGMNPELLIVNNPSERFRRGGHRVPLHMRRHYGRSGAMRRKRKHARNSPITIKFKGKKRTYRGFLKAARGLPLRKIRSLWRRSKKFHGASRDRVIPYHRKRRGHRKGHRKAHGKRRSHAFYVKIGKMGARARHRKHGKKRHKKGKK